VIELAVGIATFALLLGAAFGALHVNARLPNRHLQDDTNATVRLIGNLFVVMTSLAIGLMMNAARNTVESSDRNVRALSTDLILLDRRVRTLGPEGVETRQYLREYVETVLKNGNIVLADPGAEDRLDAAGSSLLGSRPTDDPQRALWNDARDLFRQTVQQRWVMVNESGRAIPRPLIVLLICWLMAIFGSFGYRAPRNAVVMTALALASLLVSATLYVILDMDAPAWGLIQTSSEPFARVLAEMKR
jgi:hypothetical protein